jgi:integrase/recombinase XerD
MTALAPVLQAFFTQRLTALGASPHTIASYRDTFRLLLRFTQQRTGITPSRLDLADVTPELVIRFLDHLDTDRGNSVGTRNVRLAAIHALFHDAALRCPEHAALIQQILAVPAKRRDKPTVAFLTQPEQDALLAAPDRGRWHGRRDHLLLTVGLRTGLRLSELASLTVGSITLGTGAHVRCVGKGRRARATPLTKDTAALITAWLEEREQQSDSEPLFPTITGRPMSRDAIELAVSRHVATATTQCPSLLNKHVTVHTLRHSCAMDLLQAGTDTSTIALWLGHADSRSTSTYLHADLALKEKTLAKVAPTPQAAHRYQPADPLLAFLESL